MRHLELVAAATRSLTDLLLLRRRLWSALLVAALGVLFGGTAAFWVFPQRALAQSLCEFVNHYNTLANAPNQHHGVRVFNPGMLVFHETPECIHVSSILAVDTTTYDQMEVGWQDTLNGYPYNNGNCVYTGDGQPHTIRVVNRGGVEHCTNYGALNFDGYESYGVADQNGDNNWTFYEGGGTLGTNPVTNSFSLSLSITNGERYTELYPPPSESADAYFGGLMYMPLNGSWTNWGNANCYLTDPYAKQDPVYNNQILSATTVQVSTQGSNGC